MPKNHLSLREARRVGRLADFIAQEEARGFDAADSADLMKVLSTAIKQPRSEDQTSRSSARGGSTEK